MADAILMAGGTGGVSSNDVTAGKAQVLQGYKTVTTDSDDEVIEGTIPKRGTWSTASEVVNVLGENTVHVRFEEGYYNKDGQYKPTTKIPYAVLSNVLGVDANKMLSNANVAGVTGNIKMVDTKLNNYTNNKARLVAIDGNRGKLIMWLGYGNAYYFRDDNNPHVEVDASEFGTAGADSVLQGKTATSQHGINFQGTIPRWICNTGDVITALGGEGFAWDDTHANRGRGIVVKIPNGRYIQGANWVFLPSPNHLPHNIVKDININGVTGTRDWADRTNEYAISSNVSVSQLQNNQPIALGNAFSGSETLFIGVDLMGVDVDGGLVRRDKGNGRRNIGRILLGKNDSNFVATFIRRCPAQIELSRDWAGNMSFILHIPDGWNFGQTQFYVYIYGHSSVQNNL